MLFIRWPISLYRGAKPAVSKSTGILKWSSANGHKIVPGLISLNRALRKNHPHQRGQKKFSKTSIQVLYAGMDSLSYPAPWKKAKPQSTDGIKMNVPQSKYHQRWVAPRYKLLTLSTLLILLTWFTLLTLLKLLTLFILLKLLCTAKTLAGKPLYIDRKDYNAIGVW